MIKPIIGISANMTNRHIPEFRGAQLSYIPTQFEKGITQAGGVPLIFPITSLEFIPHYVSMVDGILLVGGYDITPSFYGEEPLPQLQDTLYERDVFELALIKEAKKQKKAILGVCRGMQLINVAHGGTLYQDIPTQLNVTNNHVVNENIELPSHTVITSDNSHIQKALGKTVAVNTLHHQAIKQIGDQLKPTAYSDDNLIEAIESTTDEHFILGVQWHPELMLLSQQQSAIDIFSYFVQNAKKQ